MKRRKIILIIAGILILVFTTAGVFAAETTIAERDTADNVFSSINLPANCEKDFYWFGDSLTVDNPKIGYDGIIAGKTISFNGGKIGASLRVAAQNLTFTNLKVAHNMTLAGQNISIGQGTTSDGAYLAGQNIDYQGTSNYLGVAGKDVYINGVIKGDVKVAADNVTIGSNTVIKGTLTCDAGNQPVIDDGAQIQEKIVHVNKDIEMQKNITKSFNWGLKIFLLIGALIVGVFMCLVMRKPLKEAGEMIVHRPVAMLVSGLVALIVTPIASIILMCTVIGIPVGFLILTLFILILAVSTVFTGASLPLVIFKNMNRWLAALIGIVVLIILGMIPVVGVIVKIATILYTLGYFIQVAYLQMKGNSKKNREQTNTMENQGEITSGSDF